MQYNVVSRETMLDAQVHPEQHKFDRPRGWLLGVFQRASRQTQDDIIARTEQVLYRRAPTSAWKVAQAYCYNRSTEEFHMIATLP